MHHVPYAELRGFQTRTCAANASHRDQPHAVRTEQVEPLLLLQETGIEGTILFLQSRHMARCELRDPPAAQPGRKDIRSPAFKNRHYKIRAKMRRHLLQHPRIGQGDHPAGAPCMGEVERLSTLDQPRRDPPGHLLERVVDQKSSDAQIRWQILPEGHPFHLIDFPKHAVRFLPAHRLEMPGSHDVVFPAQDQVRRFHLAGYTVHVVRYIFLLRHREHIKIIHDPSISVRSRDQSLPDIRIPILSADLPDLQWGIIRYGTALCQGQQMMIFSHFS